MPVPAMSDSSELLTIEEAKKRFLAEHGPGLAVGFGHDDRGRLTLELDVQDPAKLEGLPKTFDGYPVRAMFVGVIRPS